MKFLTIQRGTAWVPAVIADGQAVVLPDRYPDLVAFIEGDKEAMAEVAAHVRRAGAARVPLDEVVVGSPITRFRRDVLCCGWNYWDHFYESEGKREGQDVPRPNAPTFFTKSPDTVIGPLDDIAFDERVSKNGTTKPRSLSSLARPGEAFPRRSRSSLTPSLGWCSQSSRISRVQS